MIRFDLEGGDMHRSDNGHWTVYDLAQIEISKRGRRIAELEHELEMLVHPMDLAKFRAKKDQPK